MRTHANKTDAMRETHNNVLSAPAAPSLPWKSDELAQNANARARSPPSVMFVAAQDKTRQDKTRQDKTRTTSARSLL